MRRVIIDCETTGLNVRGVDRVIELAAVELDGSRITGVEYQTYVNPRVKVGPEAFRVHGLSDAFLSDKPEFEDVADEFLSFIASSELVAHNAPFDIAFINKELADSGRGPLTNPVVDTLVMARTMRPNKHNSLDALAKAFKVTSTRVDDIHGALEDSRLLAKVYCHMMQIYGARGLELKIDSLAANPVDLSMVRTVSSVVTPEEIAAHRQMCRELGIKVF